jgi:hypothetical protein
VFDSTHAANLSNGEELVADLRAMAASLRRAGSFVKDENAARQKARDREHDDHTWGGLKKYVNAVFD